MTERSLIFRRHLRAGWGAVLVFLTLGLVLDALHGLKVGWYLEVANEARRLMWTLAHAHGTLLGLVNLAFAFTVEALDDDWDATPRSVASSCLLAATLLMPSGFLLGGIWQHGADPGLGVLLVPVGGLLLGVAAALTFRRVIADRRP